MDDQVIRLILDLGRSGADVQEVRQRLDELKGEKSAGGHGILGASYAAQDFLSVLTGGGGLGPALMSISNNIPQILMGFGLGAGMTGILSGLFTVVSAGIPVVEKWLSGMSGEAAEKAKKAIEEIKGKIEAANKEFEKLRNAPTAAEATEVDVLKQMLAQRPTADVVHKALAGATTDEEAIAAMDPETRERFLERRQFARWTANNGAMRGQHLAAANEAASLLLRGKQTAADLAMHGALQAGPAGDLARRRLRNLAATLPEGHPLRSVMELSSPEELKAQRQARHEAEQTRRENEHLFAQAKHNREAFKRAGQEANESAQHIRGEAARIEARNAERDRKDRMGKAPAMPPGQLPMGEAAELWRAKNAVARMAREKGIGTTPESVESAAKNVLQLVKSGMNPMQATEAAILHEMRRFQQMMGQGIRELHQIRSETDRLRQMQQLPADIGKQN